MNIKQKLHLAMINTYNIVTKRATLEDVLNSEINILAHVPDETISKEVYNMLIDYFGEIEMYEKCSELSSLSQENFNEDGTPKEILCECDYPEFNGYEEIIKCNKCKKPITK